MKTPKTLLNNDELIVVSYNAPAITYATVGRTSANHHNKKRALDEDDDDDEDGSRVTTPVHCVIKSKTFDVVIGSAKDSVDFRKAKIGASLVYESSGDAVERKSGEPMEFDVLPSKDGRTATIELRVNVLSSQQEGALFCARVAVEPVGAAAAAARGRHYEVQTEPIRVVSKKSQLDAGNGCKKRSRTTQVATREAVLEMIEKMDEQMAGSQAAMQSILKQNTAQAALIQSLLARLEAIHGEPGANNTSEVASSVASAPPTIEAAFSALLDALSRAGASGGARLTSIGRTLDAPQWQLLAPLHSALAPPPPLPLDYDLHMVDHRVFLSGSAGNLFGLGGV